MIRQVLLGFCLSMFLATSTTAADPKPWKAGVARTKITPPQPMWMSGYAGRDKPAEGTLTDLWAKAIVLEDPTGRRCVLVTLDLVGIDRQLSLEACDRVRKELRVPREAIVLSCSHTHTGPVVRGNLDAMYNLDAEQQKRIDDYKGFLLVRIVATVEDALKNLAPARLNWANGSAGFAVNRRENKEPEVPKLREDGKLKGPNDHDVPVLKVTTPEGKMRAIVFGYACHATVLNFFKWSGDYPGFAMLNLEKAHPDCVAMFWAGCGADQNPLPRRTVELAEKYGNELADAVSSVLKKPMKPIDGKLSLAYSEIELPFADLPTREKIVMDTMNKDKYIVARAKHLLKQIEEKGSLAGNYPYPVQAWRLGDGPTLTTLGGEVVVDYSLRLKKELGADSLWVMAYANDVMAYIPSLRVLKEGGYEGGGAMVYYGLPTVWSPEVEDRIIAAVHRVVKQVRK